MVSKSRTIREHLDANSIKYYQAQAILYTNVEGNLDKVYGYAKGWNKDAFWDKDSTLEDNYTTTRPYLPDEALKKKKGKHEWNGKTYETQEVLVIATGERNNLCVVDIDSPGMEDLYEGLTPTTFSQRKKLPHIYFRCNDMKLKTGEFTYNNGKADLLYGPNHIITERADQKMEELHVYDWETEKQRFTPHVSSLQSIAKQTKIKRKDVKAVAKINDTDTSVETVHRFGSVNEVESVDTELISTLIGFLSKKRSSEYDSWKSVGLCLKNIGGSIENFDSFSQLCKSKYDAAQVVDFWNAAKPDGSLTIGSLKYWAKEDSPRKYAAHMKSLKLLKPDNSDDDLTDFQVMVKLVIKTAVEKGYNRLNGNIVVKHPTIPHVYESVWIDKDRDITLTVAQFINSVLLPTGILDNHPRNTSDIQKWAEITDNAEFSLVMHPSRNLIGFTNGIFELDKMELTPFNKFKYTGFAPHIVMYQNTEFNKELLNDCSDVAEWKQVFDYQGFTDEERSMIEVMLGKMLFPIGIYDKWEMIPWLVGASGVGKTTAITPLNTLIPVSETGIVSSNTSTQFGLAAQRTKAVVIVDDAPQFIGKGLSRDIYNQIAQAGVVTLDVKNKKAETGKWTAPILFTSNYIPNFNENGSTEVDSNDGSIRRSFLIPFLRVLSDDVKDANILTTIKANHMHIALSCAQKYRKFAVANVNLTGMIPDKFTDFHADTFMDDDPIAQFINNNEDYSFNGSVDDCVPLTEFSAMMTAGLTKKWNGLKGVTSLQKLGFTVEACKICKKCKQPWNAKSACSVNPTAHKDRTNRSSSKIVRHMKITPKNTRCLL